MINGFLEKLLSDSAVPSLLLEAMRYSVFPGGKRFRPLLTLSACEAVGGDISKALPVGCAIELIHNYSLIHDDLPCMDNDDFRRGKPSAHKRFGCGIALLAGDALLTYAFEVLGKWLSGSTLKRVLIEIASSSGPAGMVGGQLLDITEGKIEDIHAKKTMALIRASVRCGAIVGEASGNELHLLTEYAERLGIAFQIVDDILDFGKEERLTYPAVYGISDSVAEAERLIEEALSLVELFGEGGKDLVELALMVKRRMEKVDIGERENDRRSTKT
ncbi:MAG: polyprenyl synthetase family protein [Synergistetes bacterium]|nr:polyprenyl synthetase family protein [Synergistota bacterium]